MRQEGLAWRRALLFWGCCFDGGFGLAGEVVFDESVDERSELLVGAGEHEGFGLLVPIEFEAGGESGDPYLADGGVGGDDELALGLIEEDVQDAVLLFDFKAGVICFFAGEEMLLEGFKSGFGEGAEFEFIELGASVARRGAGGRWGVAGWFFSPGAWALLLLQFPGFYPGLLSFPPYGRRCGGGLGELAEKCGLGR